MAGDIDLAGRLHATLRRSVAALARTQVARRTLIQVDDAYCGFAVSTAKRPSSEFLSLAPAEEFGRITDLMFNAEIELYRDHTWRRTPELRVENAIDAERFIESLGFCSTLTDARRPGPALYIAVCGRRDAFMPRHVQKDPEANLAWHIKDEVMRRGQMYYAKLVRGRSTFIAPRLISHFNALWGVPRRRESKALSPSARSILKVLRREWEIATSDLREASRVSDRARFLRALDELQRAMKVIPGEVVYAPSFTYIWALAEGRFPQELSKKVSRREALREVARAFLQGAGLTGRGELSRVTGLSRSDAGLGNHRLVDEGYAERLEAGVYRLVDFENRMEKVRL